MHSHVFFCQKYSKSGRKRKKLPRSTMEHRRCWESLLYIKHTYFFFDNALQSVCQFMKKEMIHQHHHYHHPQIPKALHSPQYGPNGPPNFLSGTKEKRMTKSERMKVVMCILACGSLSRNMEFMFGVSR